MGVIADNLKKRKGGGVGDIESLLQLASEEGVKAEAPEPKISTLNKIFGVLSAGETAPLAQSLLKGEGLLWKGLFLFL